MIQYFLIRIILIILHFSKINLKNNFIFLLSDYHNFFVFIYEKILISKKLYNF